MVFPPGFFVPVHCRNQVAAACRRTPIRAPIREPRHTTWPYLHVCTRGGRAPPWNFRYTGFRLVSLPVFVSCTCKYTHVTIIHYTLETFLLSLSLSLSIFQAARAMARVHFHTPEHPVYTRERN